MNWILMPVRNALNYTQASIKSLRAQTISDCKVLVIDNSSTDGTLDYLRSQYPFVITLHKDPPLSVSASWNKGLELIFQDNFEHVLVVNNDTEFLPQTYETLVNYHHAHQDVGMVTAVGVNTREQFVWDGFEEGSVRPHPDFSCYLLPIETWKKVGKFDENFKGAYCEDADYHLRMHRAGLKAVSIGIPFLHHASGTAKCAPEKEQAAIHDQAHLNRVLFREKYGVEIGSPEYYDLFREAPQEEPLQLPLQPQP